MLTAAARRGGKRGLAAAVRRVEAAYIDKDGFFRAKWVEEFGALNRKTFSLASRELSAATGFNFGTPPQEFFKAAIRRAEMLADQVGATNAANVTSAMAEVLRDSGSIADVKAAIYENALTTDMSLARAERIARTEVGGALNEGEYARALDADVFEIKEWLHSGNRRAPREWHVDMDGEEAAMDEPFSNGLMFPGEQGAPAEEVVNCGCGVIYRV